MPIVVATAALSAVSITSVAGALTIGFSLTPYADLPGVEK